MGVNVMKVVCVSTGEVLGTVLTNHSMTLDEALDFIGAEVDEDGQIVLDNEVYDWEDLDTIW